MEYIEDIEMETHVIVSITSQPSSTYNLVFERVGVSFIIIGCSSTLLFL